MPIRSYQCPECGHAVDNLERSPEEALTACPECESPKIEKVLTAHGGYSMQSGPSSVRPRGAGSFKRRPR